MDVERHIANFRRTLELAKKFEVKEYRDSYVAAQARRFLARQIRKFRGEKSQEEFGELLGKSQTIVSRLEDPKYGRMTLETLLELASKLDVALFVRFVDFPTFIKYTEDVSEIAARPNSYYDTREVDQWPRVHSCLNDWCQEQREECQRCEAVCRILIERGRSQSEALTVPQCPTASGPRRAAKGDG